MRTILLLVFSFLILSGCDKKKEPPVMVLYQNTMASDDGNWPNAANSSCCKFSNGHYEMRLDANATIGDVQFSYVPSAKINTGFSLKASATIVPDAAGETGYAGFVYDLSGPSLYYLFLISSSGNFSVYENLAGKPEVFAPWQPSSKIKTGSGAVNQIEIDQHDMSVDFIVNGSIILTLADAHKYDFRVAIAGGTGVETVYFTDIVLTTLD